jgi:hypothetical protein
VIWAAEFARKYQLTIIQLSPEMQPNFRKRHSTYTALTFLSDLK